MRLASAFAEKRGSEDRMSEIGYASDLQLQLARKIVQQIHDGSIRPGEHLREIELSKEFSVSRTPLRAALSYLTNHGLIEKRAHQGFFVAAAKPDYPKMFPSIPKTDDEQIKECIAKDWFIGTIDQEVSESEIRGRYGLGRLTAQRILNSLSMDGVVTRMPGYGWQFQPTLNSVKAHDESYQFRLIIEPQAIRSPDFSLSIAGAEALRENHNRALEAREEDLSIAELFQLDANFHSFIAECSGNRFILESITKQNQLRRLLEYNSLINAGRLRASCMEHLEILHCLTKNKQDTAAELMQVHLKKAQRARPDF